MFNVWNGNALSEHDGAYIKGKTKDLWMEYLIGPKKDHNQEEVSLQNEIWLWLALAFRPDIASKKQ